MNAGNKKLPALYFLMSDNARWMEMNCWKSKQVSNGKIYIGSATGENGIWQRWCSYAKDFTGDNKDFKNIVKEKGEDYIRNNFTYAILEIFDMKTKDDYIISRERYWMKVFQTRKFGMNN